MAGLRAATDALEDLAQRRPERDLGDRVPARRAAHGAHHRTRRRLGTELAEPVGTLGEDARDVGHRLDVVGERRRCDALAAGFGELEVGRGLGAVADLVEAVPPRRCDAREGLPTVEHLEQTGLLAVQVAARTRERAQLDVVGPTGGAHFRDRAFEASAHDREVGFDRDDDLAGFERVRGDQRAFDHTVGVRPQDHAVLERTGLALGTVHDHRRGVDGRLVRGDGLPLPTRREPGAAASPQTGRDHRRDRLVGRTGARLAQPAPAAHRDVRIEVFDRFGVQDAAATPPLCSLGARYPRSRRTQTTYGASTTGGPSRRSRTRDATTATVNSTTMTPSEIAVGMCHQCDTAIFAPTKISTRPSP